MNEDLRWAITDVTYRLLSKGWFTGNGVHCIVDGQFGSTGKGVAASLLEETLRRGIGNYAQFIAETSAGPNSGHTAIYGGHQMITRQLPISAVQNHWIQGTRGGGKAYLNAGAVISIEVLLDEVKKFDMQDRVIVHPNAAIIEDIDIERETIGGPAFIASTGKGVGSALARKIMRENLCAKSIRSILQNNGVMVPNLISLSPSSIIILEVAQGFSLGINQPFYPYSTSRECTVMQALADACIHPKHLRKTLMVMRTFPIRVGNTDKGESGGSYVDQHEMKWEEINVEPELTTVTKRVRRLFNWSWLQFEASMIANRPDALFMNFCNYLPVDDFETFMQAVLNVYIQIMDRPPDAIICGWGPETHSVTLWDK